MTEERRQIARRTPIECQLEDGRVFVARPLPWTSAGDFGNEVMRQNSMAANEFIKMWVEDSGLPQLELQFQQKITDWISLLRIGFPDITDEEWSTPSIPSMEECASLALAVIEVNHLGQLKHLVDPNSTAPMNLGGIVSSGMEMAAGAKTESTPDSSSVVSPATLPST